MVRPVTQASKSTPVQGSKSKPVPKGAKNPSYQSAYHGEPANDPLTRFFTWMIEKVDKAKVPKNTLDTLPFEQIYSDGLCRVKGKYFTRMVQFFDINYQLAQNDEKQHIF